MNKQAKPFVKWAGGKGQLLEQLELSLPSDLGKRENFTYIEPFVGGGALLFHMLQKYTNIKRSVINDINPDLTTCYRTVRDHPTELVNSLKELQNEYRALPNEQCRRDFYMQRRDNYNHKQNCNEVENTTLFIFLNRTCFNGLYRVNKSGLFNVPFGKYVSPTICDAETILADSRVLQNTEILSGNYDITYQYAGNDAFFYFDPPYRPLSNTSNFTNYAREPFDDKAQTELKLFCDKIDACGSRFMLSNADCLAADNRDAFFDELYAQYNIKRVLAARSINSVASLRGKKSELLINNYTTAHNRKPTQQLLFNPDHLSERYAY